jgi:thiol-disulfide isomerase/thioredoxin
MALYLKSCFLAFLCLYRSKSHGIRKKRIDRSKHGAPLSYYFKSRWNPFIITHAALCKWLYPSDRCPAHVRLRALTALGSKYPRSLNAVLWLASLALTVRVTIDRIVGTVTLSEAKGLLPLRVGRSPAILRDRLSPPQEPDQDDEHQLLFHFPKCQILNTAIGLIRERLLLISLRFAKVRTKGLAYRKHSLKDGSRYVCVPSYLKTKNPLLTVLFLLVFHLSGISQTKPVYIYGEIISDVPLENFQMILHRDYFGISSSLESNETTKIPLHNITFFHGTMPDTRLFYIELELEKPAYLTLHHRFYHILDKYVIMPGDSLYLQVDHFKSDRYYMGSHASHYDVQHQIRKETRKASNLKTMSLLTQDSTEFMASEQRQADMKAAANHSPYKSFQIIDMESLPSSWSKNLSEMNIEHPGLKVLQSYKGKIPEQLYEILEADLLAERYSSNFKSFHANVTFFGSSPGMEALYQKHMRNLPDLRVTEQAKLASAEYQDMVVNHAKLVSRMEGKEVFDVLYGNYDGELRNRVLINYLGTYFKNISGVEDKLQKTMEVVTDPNQLYHLEQLMASNKLGQEMPELKMKSIDGETVALDEFKGKVLLLDFWFTGCQPCLMLYKTTLKPLKERLESIEDVQILSINVESSEERWKKSVSEGKYTSPEGHNFYIGKRTDHPFLKHYKVNGFPTLMVVDKEGKLYSFAGTPRDLDELERLLLEARNIN